MTTRSFTQAPTTMRTLRSPASALVLGLLMLIAACSDMSTNPVQATTVAASKTPSRSIASCGVASNPNNGAFDALGYNRTARIFNGKADGTDGVLNGLYWGNPTYACDHLNMKWNSEWDRGNAEGWSDPNGYDAWLTNNWNGQVLGGSGDVWHYKFKYVGPCGATGTPLPDGSYCIWTQFAVIFSQGSSANQHFWDAHANVGLGTK